MPRILPETGGIPHFGRPASRLFHTRGSPVVKMGVSTYMPSFGDAYRRNRERSRSLFDLLSSEAYYCRPIDLRHPVVFYEGHLPAFSFNTLIKRALGRPGIDARLEDLFARGIDPAEAAAFTSSERHQWPDRSVVQAFADEADAQVIDALEREDLFRPGHPLLDGAEAASAIIEHEAMH